MAHSLFMTPTSYTVAYDELLKCWTVLITGGSQALPFYGTFGRRSAALAFAAEQMQLDDQHQRAHQLVIREYGLRGAPRRVAV